MGWRLHLADKPLAAVHFVEGDELQVCAWLSADQAEFYSVRSGVHCGSLSVSALGLQHESLKRREILDGLRSPTGAFLPHVITRQETIYTSYDGRLRLIHQSESPFLRLEADGMSAALAVSDDDVVAVAFDRQLGSSFAVLSEGQIHIFQQTIPIGSLDLGPGFVATSVVPLLADAGSFAAVVSLDETVAFDLGGNITDRVAGGSACAACSPDGKLMVMAGQLGRSIRVLNDRLNVLYEDRAQYLIGACEPLQLVAAFPSEVDHVVSVDITHDGIVAFAWGGYLCVLTIREMTALPQAKELL